MIRRSLSFIISMTLAGNLYAQEQKSILQLAEEAYLREEYAIAGPLYQRQARVKGDKMPVALLMKMAHSYQEIGRFREAAGFYQQIIARADRPAAAYFAYGDVLRQLEQYDSARQQYALFSTANTDSVKLKEIALRGCDSAEVWKQTPAPIQLKPMNTLNTPGSDISSGFTREGLLLLSNGYRELVLSGVSETRPHTDKRTQQPFYKAYIYRQNKQGNPTMYLEELNHELLGKYDFHIGPVCMNAAEDTLYATINIQGKNVPVTGKGPMNGVRQLQIWQSVKKDGKWEKPALLPGINVQGYSSSHAVLNTSGNILYFVSDRPGGIGQSDLWYCEKQTDGSWSAPVNCGEKINTIAAETFPTINEDGVLYFSSKGYPGFGGYDIFRAEGEKTNWETPVNMKAPVNSGADDMGFVKNNKIPEVYLASNKQGGTGSDDIYYFLEQNIVTVPDTRTPENIPSKEEGSHQTPGKGKEEGKGKGLNTADEADRQSVEQSKILYAYNSALLSAESRLALDKVAEMMNAHNNWKLAVASFADSRGTDTYNFDLSSKRCLSVIGYLAEKGIAPARLYYFNKGELEPVNGCKDGVPCSEEQYRLNRRSELKVMR